MRTTRRGLFQGAAALFATPILGQTVPASNGLMLRYTRPAAEWTDALPLGNGHLGAMVFGGVPQERIQVNEATLWGGGPHDYAVPGAGRHLEELRRLIFSAQIESAEKLTSEMMGQPPLLLPYQPFCDLGLIFEGSGEVSGYTRILSLDDATASISYRRGGAAFRRDVFVSHPDKVIVVRLTGDRAGAQNVSITLGSPLPGAAVEAVGGDTLKLEGQIQPRDNPRGSWVASWNEPGIRYAAVLRVRAVGGTVRREDNRLHVEDADTVTILLSAATSFRSYRDAGGDATVKARRAADAAARKTYDSLKRAHLMDFRRLFRRVELHLGTGVSADDTDARIRNFDSTNDPDLIALCYQFGRYLLISSSRPCGQPANLQGIWNQDLVPAWGSKWTTNINLEMNYWLAESGALWENQEPLWSLIDDLRVTGAETARAHYGAGGWVLHHNTDIWRAATPVDGAWGMWPMGGVWLANQMWDHYQFSLDESFLRTRAYPAMRGALRFVLDTLVEAPKGTRFAGSLVTCPSTSPENAYLLDGRRASLTYAATMDIELISELIDAFVQASRVLGEDAGLRAEAVAARGRLPPLQIGARGQLQEWIEDYPETEPDHRHVSHLWALYPGHGISRRRTPGLAEAARRSLELRGDGGTGWSIAWKAALWARLGDGDHACRLLQRMISKSTLPNMFGLGPPFQIDGNFGGAAAVAEMLLQSDREEIDMLPALPGAWPRGRVRGLRARGCTAVDIEWRDHRLARAVLTSGKDRAVVVRSGALAARIELPARIPVRLDGALRAG